MDSGINFSDVAGNPGEFAVTEAPIPLTVARK
jgi:hypothetical protein